MVKQISDNEISVLIKYIKSVLWRVAKRLSYTEDARWLKVKLVGLPSIEVSVKAEFITWTSTQSKMLHPRLWAFCTNLHSKLICKQIFP